MTIKMSYVWLLFPIFVAVFASYEGQPWWAGFIYGACFALFYWGLFVIAAQINKRLIRPKASDALFQWSHLSLFVLPSVGALGYWHHFDQPLIGFVAGVNLAVIIWLAVAAKWAVKRL